MARKAFTLVEMAIVVFIVGVILGVTLKGKSLVDRSKLKSEIRKIEKIQVALSSFFSANGRLPSYISPDNSTLDTSELLSGHFSVPSDFDIGIKPNGNYNYVWGLFGCLASNTAAGGYIKGDAKGFCLAPSDNTTHLLVQTLSGYFACNIEAIYDDKSYKFGNGRYISNVSPIEPNSYENCDKNLDSVAYAFRIW